MRICHTDRYSCKKLALFDISFRAASLKISRHLLLMYVPVKGVNFYGPRCEYVVSGSDCGNVFLWDKQTANIVNYFHADDGGVVRSFSYCLQSVYNINY